LIDETLTFEIIPISVNKCFRSVSLNRKGRSYTSSIKSKEYREFEHKLCAQIRLLSAQIKRIATGYIPGKNFYIVDYIFKFPRSRIITKAGNISKTCGDTDNFIKPIQDQVFKALKVYNKDADDSAIVGFKALRIPHELPTSKVIIRLRFMEELDGVKIY